MKKLVNSLLNRIGYHLTNIRSNQSDMVSDPVFAKIWNRCSLHTMTSIEKMYILYTAVTYLEDNHVDGSFIECGVWRGGSVMTMLFTLLAKQNPLRQIEIFDLFDNPDRDGKRYWEAISQQVVESNLNSVGYPKERIRIVPGDILTTLDSSYQGEIALLRLDTDLFESTAHSLRILYPLVKPGGIVIIDDYGSHPDGAGRAVREYFGKNNLSPFLSRIDGSGRFFIKPLHPRVA